MRIHGALFIFLILVAVQARSQSSQFAAGDRDEPAPRSTGAPSLELGEVGALQPGSATFPNGQVSTVGPVSRPTSSASQATTGTQGKPATKSSERGPSPSQRPNAKGAPDQNTEGNESTATAAAKSSRPERIEFNQRPVRIALKSAERYVTFPNPVAISMPEGADNTVTLQIVDRTAYVSAIATETQFGKIRAIAEDLVTGQMIPIDFTRAAEQDRLPDEVHIHFKKQSAPAVAPTEDKFEEDSPPLDIVALTRHAAQSTYAPKRLIPANDAVHPVSVDNKNIAGLFRGIRTSASPLGQWRSGDLYVTAVRISNLEKHAVDLDLEQVRGSWIAATLQHHRLHQAGSDFDTTTMYLVCGQPFDACK